MHSNSSLNVFANCMKRYEHQYILKTPTTKPISPHFVFGSMAHDVLYKAGNLRDLSSDGVVSKDEYYSIIPSEILYGDLKREFEIHSWEKYFYEVIKATSEYENEIIKGIRVCDDASPITVLREHTVQLTGYELDALGIKNIKDGIKGIIDLLVMSENFATIIDYKFSNNKKTQDDFDMNSQLQLYAMLVHLIYNIPLRNIQIGYIDIPKQDMHTPIVLSNGTLSRAKSQNISQKMYENAVKAVHGDNDEKYNCNPDGYYYDVWCYMALNKPAYFQTQYLDMSAYKGITGDLLDTAVFIEIMKERKYKFLCKYDSYSCKTCDFLDTCKPWLKVRGDFE